MDVSREFATLVAKLVELEFSNIDRFQSLIDLSKANPNKAPVSSLCAVRRLSLQGV